MFRVAWLQSLTIKQQLALGFGTLVTLLIAISFTAHMGLKSTYQGFVDYRTLARETNLAGRIQANLLMMRIEVLKFLDNHSENSLSRYQRRGDMMQDFVKQADGQVNNPARLTQINSIKTGIETYRAAFSDVVKLSEERTQIVDRSLIPLADEISQVIAAIWSNSNILSNQTAVSQLAKLQSQWFEINSLASKFIYQYDLSIAQRTSNQLIELSNSSSALLNTLRSSGSLAMARSLDQSIATYIQHFNATSDNTRQQDHLTNGTLHVVGPRIADAIEQFKLGVKEQQDTVGPRLQDSTENLVNAVSLVAFVSLALSIFIAVLIAKNIRKPIGGEPRSICNMMEEVAHGDLTREFERNQKNTGIFKALIKMTDDLKTLLRTIVSVSNELGTDAQAGQKLNRENVKTLEQQPSYG